MHELLLLCVIFLKLNGKIDNFKEKSQPLLSGIDTRPFPNLLPLLPELILLLHLLYLLRS